MENKNKNWKISQQKQLKKLEKTVKGLSLALRSLSTWCGEVEHTQYMMLKAFAEDDDIIADTEDMLMAHKEHAKAEKVILPNLLVINQCIEQIHPTLHDGLTRETLCHLARFLAHQSATLGIVHQQCQRTDIRLVFVQRYQ